MVPYRAHIGLRLGKVHAGVLYWILLVLIVLHIGAALYHRLVRRDTVLSRMLPGW
jgi:cytochrome b561